MNAQMSPEERRAWFLERETRFLEREATLIADKAVKRGLFYEQTVQEASTEEERVYWEFPQQRDRILGTVNLEELQVPRIDQATVAGWLRKVRAEPGDFVVRCTEDTIKIGNLTMYVWTGGLFVRGRPVTKSIDVSDLRDWLEDWYRVVASDAFTNLLGGKS